MSSRSQRRHEALESLHATQVLIDSIGRRKDRLLYHVLSDSHTSRSAIRKDESIAPMVEDISRLLDALEDLNAKLTAWASPVP
jgi:hypothetical protein